MKRLVLLVIVLIIGIYPIKAQASCGIHDNRLATVGPRVGQIDVYWVNGNGAISTAYWTNGGWSDTFSVTPNGAAHGNSPVETLVPYGDEVDVYWISPQGEVKTAFWAGQWSETFSTTPPNVAASNSSLEAIVPRGDQVDLYWVSPEGAIKSTFWTGQWNPVLSLTSDNAVRSGSPLKAIVPRGDQVDLYWVSPDGSIMSMYYSSNGWSQSFAIAGANAAHPDTDLEAIGTPNSAAVYWVDTTGALVSATWNNGGVWGSPQSITSPNSVLPGTTLAIAGGFDKDTLQNRIIPAPVLFWSSPSGTIHWGDISYDLSVTEATRAYDGYQADNVEDLDDYSSGGPADCANGYDTGLVSWTDQSSSNASYITFFAGKYLKLLQVTGFVRFD